MYTNERSKCVSKNFLPIFVLTIMVIFMSFIMSACTSAPAKNAQRKTRVTPTASPDPLVQVLPEDAIPIQQSFRELVHLRGQNDITTTQGTFTSNGSYQILAVCEGKGSMKIDYMPQGSTTFQCTSDAQVYEVNMQDPPKGEVITVIATPPGMSLWEVSVQIAQ